MISTRVILAHGQTGRAHWEPQAMQILCDFFHAIIRSEQAAHFKSLPVVGINRSLVLQGITETPEMLLYSTEKGTELEGKGGMVPSAQMRRLWGDNVTSSKSVN